MRFVDQFDNNDTPSGMKVYWNDQITGLHEMPGTVRFGHANGQ
jgi:hypothetical protein